jgi:hypothetical protein
MFYYIDESSKLVMVSVRVAGGSGVEPPCYRPQPTLLIAHLTRQGLKEQRRGRGREGRGGPLF